MDILVRVGIGIGVRVKLEFRVVVRISQGLGALSSLSRPMPGSTQALPEPPGRGLGFMCRLGCRSGLGTG